jgi:hypothetical protein
MFLVDASISVNNVILGGPPNAYQELVLPFVASVAERLDADGLRLADGSFRVSLASFASNATEHVAFDAHTDPAVLRAAIEASPYAAGATRTSLGFELVNNTVLPQARPLLAGVPRILIVIVDGPASLGFDAAAAAADLRSQDTTILAVGFNSADVDELTAMASVPAAGDTTVFQVSQAVQLSSLLPAVSEQACEIAERTLAPTVSPTASPNIAGPFLGGGL